jgi:hypothetical protein
VSSFARRLSRNSVGGSSTVRVNVAGLAAAAAGMLVQMGAGSTLYPSLAGPIVLLATAAAVALVGGLWARWLGLVVPAVLGVGALAAAAMNGQFVDQLTAFSNPGLVLGSVLHALGLVAAVAGGIGMVMGTRAGERGD